jgi:glycosyltransferase involved in cell wall biosynthesis
MVAVLSNSEELRKDFGVSLSFRDTPNYSASARNRLHEGIVFQPLKLSIPEITGTFKQPKLGLVLASFRFVKYFFQYMVCSLQNFYTLYRAFVVSKPDILHVNNGGFPGALSCRIAVLAGRAAGIKNILFVVNNMAIPYEGLYRKVDFVLDKLVARLVYLFITGSGVASRRLKEVLKLPEYKLTAIPNGVEIFGVTEEPRVTLQRLNAQDYKIIFGVVGIMLPRKGHALLLQAISNLKHDPIFKESSLVFLLEGTGELLSELVELASSLQVNRFVRFVGVQENIFNFYGILDFLVYPSTKDEDFPNVISEALGMSIPVISAKVAGAVEQIDHGINGLLFDKGDCAALENAILEICRNPDAYRSMAVNARRKYELYYKPAKAIQQYKKIYDAILGGGS